MKKTISLSILFLVLIFVACNNSSNQNENKTSADSKIAEKANTNQNFNLDTTKLKSGEAFYQCEMHPEVLSDKPGNCPKCGMELLEMNIK